ncbi:LOW QUALITY PROTEIN: spatacsin [Bufo gargarizans]|uniref:LOW QUALITY PROTEIN: spatacsin n=1 Tax=Bufo gargarizans TaxID=30331 RepID=UPI001CF413F3|nr:LOW QUALITY PROTEIN: spatacsin [Bufo gargarizans]
MELSVLLDPSITLQDWTELPLKVSLTRLKNLTLCSLLPDRSLCLTVFTSRTRACTQLDGPFTQFLWEDENHNETALDQNPRVLILGQNNDICVYEVSTEDGQVTLATLCLCDEDTLRQLCAENHVCVPSLFSVLLLSLHGDDIFILLSSSVFVHLCYSGKDQKPNLVSCFCLDLDPETTEHISDACLRHEILFLLNTSGFIYVFDTLDGSLVADIELPSWADIDTAEKLKSIRVSSNLDLIVVSSERSCFLALRLSENLRENINLALQKWRNERHSKISFFKETQRHDFQMDRSWDATLLSLLYKTKSSPGFPVCHQTASLQLRNSSSGAAFRWTVVGGGWVKVLKDNIEDPLSLHIWSVTSYSVLFYVLQRDGYTTLIHWDMDTPGVNYHALGKALCVYSPDDEAPLVITDRGLSLVLFSVTQNEFLTRLMIHGSASTADTLCHLNNWGRCSVPIHTLEAGLDNRQLDTVDFFLKSKESILSSLTSEDGAIHSEVYLCNVQDLVPALDLLSSYIRGTDQEAQSKHFSEQLLQLTLRFLNAQLLTLCNLQSEPDPGLEQCVGILTGYITKLRPFMKKFQQQQPPLPLMTPHAGRRHGAWENMTVENIISDAILTNCIPEAQTFLREQGHHLCSLTWLKREGLKLVYRCLLECSVSEACQLLQNMGYSIWDELHRICLHTSDLGVRTLLVDLLQKEGLFSEQQQQAIHTVCKLEELYCNTCRTSEEKKNVLNARPSWRICAKSQEVKKLQDALTAVRDEPETLLLHWAKDWDCETQESLLLPWRKNTDMSAVAPKILWRHLTMWHNWTQVASWIESIGLPQEKGDIERPLWPLISPTVIDTNTLCCSYMRQKILDELSRMNIFIPSEVEDFELLVERLAISGRLMELTTSKSPDVHNSFVVLCVERGLQYMLYSYLDCHRLNPETCSALAKTTLHETYPWFGFLVHIRQVCDHTDADRMFQASLSNAHMLMPGCQPSVNNMLLDGHTLLALATIMYAPGGIDGVLKQCEEPSLCQWNVDLPLLKMALTPYPKLRAALFSQHPSNAGSPPDITLYHLLQALSPFHPAHFFTWQPTNSLAASDTSSALPHCSCPKLVKDLSVVEQLDTFFYIRSGRPAIAFSFFLVHHLLKSKVPKQLIHQVAEDVYSLALSCFHVPVVISSCVCFLELLGLSSYKLRVDVNVANIILRHSSSLQEESGHNFHIKALAQRLSKLVENEVEAAKDLLLSLEDVVDATLQQADSPLPPHRLWVTVVQFCLLHDIPMSTSYLRYCAQRQDWLQLLVHTNSPPQVFYVLDDLNPVLCSHISLALQDKVSSDCSLQRIGSDTTWDSLHHVLLKCLSMEEPGQMLLKECMRWRVPLFSALAASTQDADPISCLCAWIVTSVDAATYTEITQTMSDSVDHKWSLEDLVQIWDILLARADSGTLEKAFSIFMEDCPLRILLEMYELCLHHKNYTQAEQKVMEFQGRMTSLQSTDCSPPAPIPVLWLHARASHLLQLLLLQSLTPYELQKVLQFLCDSGSHNICEGMDIHKLNALYQILDGYPVVIRKQLIEDYSPAALQVECQRLLQTLLEGAHFALAHQVAELAELPTDNLVIEEVLQDQSLLREMGQWGCPQSRAQYWRKCHVTFCSKQLSPVVASNFFQSQASHHAATGTLLLEQMEALAEQELLFTLAGHWLSLHECSSLRTLEELEQQIWKYRIERETLNRSGGSRLLSSLSGFTKFASEFSFSGLAALNSFQLLDIFSLPPLHGDKNANSQVLCGLIDRLLDDSKVHEASRVCRYFQLSHRDVWIVLSCRALASGEMTMHQLPPDIQNIITEGKDAQENTWNRRRRLQSSSSVDSTSSQTPTNPVVTYLEVLKDACSHGKTFCRQLLCMYELSQDLGCSFSEVSSRDPREVLVTLLSSFRPELCDRAQAVITSHGLSPETVAHIVAEGSLKIWRTLNKEGGQSEVYNLSENRSNFLQLAKLCPDPTLVGLYLLDHLETVPLTELHCVIEILISAHDCFSLTCHLEGIGRVLQACRNLTEMHLAPNQEYSLMVRLLSGIGRYNDMVYVFDILHKNQHFEVLLRKQLDTKGGLQTALLEYIKRCHPGDSEKHNMTALCFSLHRDIGHNHEHAAKIQLRLIQSRPWEYWMSDQGELRSSIMKALTLLIDAAESYSKDSCVRQSLRCARLTRLLTLQLHLLNNGHQTKLINLERENLMEPILALPRFYQAVIVTEAYDLQPDWPDVLYSKVIVGGDFQYLEEFKQRQLLSGGVFEQLSNKCKLNPPGSTGLQNLKRVISYCEDINTRYKLAIENKFYDITDVLMRDSQTRCCLTDMLSR